MRWWAGGGSWKALRHQAHLTRKYVQQNERLVSKRRAQIDRPTRRFTIPGTKYHWKWARKECTASYFVLGLLPSLSQVLHPLTAMTAAKTHVMEHDIKFLEPDQTPTPEIFCLVQFREFFSFFEDTTCLGEVNKSNDDNHCNCTMHLQSSGSHACIRQG